MNKKILLSLFLLSCFPTIVLADTDISTIILGSGTTSYSSTSTGSWGTFTNTFTNTGEAAFISTERFTSTGFRENIVLAATGTGSYSASKQPTIYGFVPINVPNPSWTNSYTVGFARYKS